MNLPNLPQGYSSLPSDYPGEHFTEGQMKAYGWSCARAALLEVAAALDLAKHYGLVSTRVESNFIRRVAEEIK